jgi:hypothetical protein
MSRRTNGERIFMMAIATGAHLVSWSTIFCFILWLVRPEWGAEAIINRGCLAGAIVSGVICIPLWCFLIIGMVSMWREHRQQAFIARKLNELDLEDDDA